MAYVECFVAAVETSREAEYKEHTRHMASVFKDHGAIAVVDCWGADVPDGEVTSFPMAVKAKADETVCIGWIEWASKEARDEGMESAMQDERMGSIPMPFDGKRLIFGGFEKFNTV